ncbi:carboxypeptidase regulatory-like domain-containing protein [Gemmatimonadota bacterium]
MRTLSRLVLLAAGFLAAFPLALRAQDPDRVTLQGTVLDAVTGQPLQGVAVSMSDLGLRVLTGEDGTFVLTEIPLGVHQLALEREGYEGPSGRLMVDKAGEMEFRLNPLGGPTGSDMSQIRGTVRDRERGEGLEEAAVTLQPLGLTRLTDANGRFVFENVPPGQYRMTADLLGYSTREEPVTVAQKKIITLNLPLAVEPIELDPIEVTVEARNFDLEMTGFYERREATSGTFVTREKIEERAPLFTTDIFQGLAGVRVVGGLGMGTQKAVVVSGSRALSFNSAPGACFPAVWVDGQLVHQGSAGNFNEGPAFLDNLVQPDMVAGIEIYNSAAKVPVQYNLFAACGVIVIWTQHGR